MKVFFGGGLNESQAPDIAEAAEGSYNFELAPDEYDLKPRAPFDLIATAPNASDVRGLLQLIKRDNTSTTLVQAADTVYTWDGATTFSATGSCNASSQLRDTYWSLGDYSVITDLQKLTVVKKWDGTTFSTLSTGLGASLFAKYGIVHNGRTWLFNVTTSSDTPHLMVASAFENPQSYDTTQRATSGTFSTGLEAFYMLTPDLRPINGVAKTVAGDLVISTYEGSLFKLSGTSASNYKWDNFYPASQAVGAESMISTGNDVMYIRKGGHIESLNATQKYGDVESDDISKWIINSVEDIATGLTVYDQKNQKVFFFVSNGRVLVLFKDLLYGGTLASDKGEKKQLSPWSIYRTLHASNFTTSAARYMRRPGTTNTTIYFGGSAGQIFDLNGSGDGDGGSADIQVIRKTRLIDARDGINFMRHVTRGNVQYRRIREVGINIELDWADEYNTSTASITLKGAPASDTGAYWGGFYWGGTFYWNAGFTFANKISHQNFSMVGRGPGCFMTVSSLDTVGYKVDNIELL